MSYKAQTLSPSSEISDSNFLISTADFPILSSTSDSSFMTLFRSISKLKNWIKRFQGLKLFHLKQWFQLISMLSMSWTIDLLISHLSSAYVFQNLGQHNNLFTNIRICTINRFLQRRNDLLISEYYVTQQWCPWTKWNFRCVQFAAQSLATLDVAAKCCRVIVGELSKVGTRNIKLMCLDVECSSS